jgi:hypothetical protein
MFMPHLTDAPLKLEQTTNIVNNCIASHMLLDVQHGVELHRWIEREVASVTDNGRLSGPTEFLLYVLMYGAAAGSIALGTYLVLLFSQPEWHLAQYIAWRLFSCSRYQWRLCGNDCVDAAVGACERGRRA